MKKGFTLMELIVVVVIIGILAMIGLPQYFKVAEKGRAAEGTSVLGSIRGAQLRFAAESENGLTTANLGDLDIETTDLKYFAPPVPKGNINPRTDAKDSVIATATRNNGYTLSIAINGNITCTAGGNIDCPRVSQ